MTGRYHPDGLPDDLRPAVSFGNMAARVRRLEAQVAALRLLPVWPASAPSTSSSTAVGLWIVADSSRPDDAVTVTVVGVLSNPAADALVTLSDSAGRTLAQVPIVNSQPVNLVAPGPAVGPFTVSGSTSTGSLTVSVVGCTAGRYLADDTAS